MHGAASGLAIAPLCSMCSPAPHFVGAEAPMLKAPCPTCSVSLQMECAPCYSLPDVQVRPLVGQRNFMGSGELLGGDNFPILGPVSPASTSYRKTAILSHETEISASARGLFAQEMTAPRRTSKSASISLTHTMMAQAVVSTGLSSSKVSQGHSS